MTEQPLTYRSAILAGDPIPRREPERPDVVLSADETLSLRLLLERSRRLLELMAAELQDSNARDMLLETASDCAEFQRVLRERS